MGERSANTGYRRGRNSPAALSVTCSGSWRSRAANTYLAGLLCGSGREGPKLWPSDSEVDAMTPHFDAIFSELREGAAKGRYARLFERPVERYARSLAGQVVERYRQIAGRRQSRAVCRGQTARGLDEDGRRPRLCPPRVPLAPRSQAH